MALSFPRDVVTEMFLDGWTDISTKVRQKDTVVITRARGNEQGQSAPTKLDMVLHNDDGEFTIGNPNSPHHPLLGRNAPVRSSLRTVSDSFARNTSNGWGTAPTGEVWTAVGTAADHATSTSSGGIATHSISSTSSFRAGVLPVSMRDAYVAVVGSLAISDVTGGVLEFANIYFRRLDASNYYLVRFQVNVAEVLEFKVLQVVAGVETQVGSTVPTDLVWAANTDFRVAACIEKQTIRAVAHLASDNEPYGWDITIHDDALTLPGAVGVRSGVASGNSNTKPIVFTYKSVEVRSIRAAVETAGIQPTWNENHTNKRGVFEGGGILRRLGLPNATPLRSAAYRYITSAAAPFTLSDYWTLEETAGVDTQGASAVGGLPGIFARETGVSPNTGAVKFGVAAGLLPVPGVLELTAGARFTLPVDTATLGSSWSVTWAQRLSADAGGKVFLHNTNPDNDITLTFFTDGAYQVYLITSNPLASVLLFSGTLAGIGFDDTWHHIGFGARDLGGSTVDYALSIDGTVQTISANPVTFTAVQDVMLTAPVATTAPCAYSHVTVFPDRLDTADRAALVSAAVFGHVGETAGRRAERLCDEQGTLFDYVGDLDTTPTMGAQRPGTLLALLRQCADADQGTLYEPRSVVGIGLRTRSSIENQDAVLTLDYSAEQVAPEFQPVPDDQQTANLITAKRVGGGETVIEQTTGPLNTSEPGGGDPDGVGPYPKPVTVAVENDSQLADIGSRARARGTIPDARYPKVTVDLKATAIDGDAELESAVLDMNVDDRFLITDLTDADIYAPVDQIARGSTERFNDATQHKITFNTAPYDPYRLFVVEDTTLGRLSTRLSSLDAGIDDNDLTADVAFTDEVRWTTDAEYPDDFPMLIDIDGEEIEVSGISGTTSPQTFTFSQRSVNGVIRSHAAGRPVRPRTEARWG